MRRIVLLSLQAASLIVTPVAYAGTDAPNCEFAILDSPPMGRSAHKIVVELAKLKVEIDLLDLKGDSIAARTLYQSYLAKRSEAEKQNIDLSEFQRVYYEIAEIEARKSHASDKRVSQAEKAESHLKPWVKKTARALGYYSVTTFAAIDGGHEILVNTDHGVVRYDISSDRQSTDNLPEGAESATSFASNLDRGLLAFGMGDGRIKVTSSKGQTLAILGDAKTLESRVTKLSPDGKKVIKISSPAPEYEMVEVWDVDSGRAIEELKEIYKGTINDAQFSSDGRIVLLVADFTGAGQFGVLIDPKAGARPSTRSFGKDIDSARFNSDGTLLVTTDVRGQAAVWETKDLTQIAIVNEIGSPPAGQAKGQVPFRAKVATFGLDGESVLLGGYSSELRLVHIKSKEILSIIHPPDEHSDDPIKELVFVNPNRLIALSGFIIGNIMIWDRTDLRAPQSLASQACVKALGALDARAKKIIEELAALKYEADQHFAGNELESARVVFGQYEIKRTEAVASGIDLSGFQDAYDKIAKAGADQNRNESERTVRAAKILESRKPWIAAELGPKWTTKSNSSGFSVDSEGTKLLAPMGTEIHLYEFSTGMDRTIWAPFSDHILQYALSPDGIWTATGTFKGQVSFWRPGQDEKLLRRVGKPVQQLGFSSNGNKFFVITEDSKKTAVATIWDLNAKSEVEVPVEGILFKDAQLNSDGTMLLWSDMESAVVLNLETGQIYRFGEKAHSARFSPDGLLVATAGRNGVQIWQAKNGELVADVPLGDRSDEKGRFEAKLALFDRFNEGLILSGEGGEIRRVDPNTGEILNIIRMPNETRKGPFDKIEFFGKDRLLVLDEGKLVTLSPAPSNNTGASAR